MKAHAHEMDFSASSALKRTFTHFITKKIWLPKVVYDALPYFYLIAGVAAIVATIYIDEWYWVVPHYVLFLRCASISGFCFFANGDRQR
tara:strand:- start:263 stop:529 length:267 start_codon:yes stop_codon:yes gene_type:complete